MGKIHYTTAMKKKRFKTDEKTINGKKKNKRRKLTEEEIKKIAEKKAKIAETKKLKKIYPKIFWRTETSTWSKTPALVKQKQKGGTRLTFNKLVEIAHSGKPVLVKMGEKEKILKGIELQKEILKHYKFKRNWEI